MSVAVVTPIYRAALTATEEVSVSCLARVLRDYERIAVAPAGVSPPKPFSTTVRFDDRHFSSVQAYSQLLLSDEFYAAFESFDFLLLYQLDAFVFRDELAAWVGRGHDYVGAPFLEDVATGDRFQLPHLEAARLEATRLGIPIHSLRARARPFAVGNGGLSLRRIAKAREVLASTRRPRFKGVPYQRSRSITELLRTFLRGSLALVQRPSVSRLAREFLHEDLFWSFAAGAYVPSFSMPAPEEALAFAFETEPELCYALNNNRLPFGCHGWHRYQADFWARHMR